MRKWTGASFDAALGCGQMGDVVWLRCRAGASLRRTVGARAITATLHAAERGGAKVGRAALLVAVGCIASGVMPDLALAPVSPAMASIERLPGVPPVPVSLDIPPVPIFATSAEDLATKQDEAMVAGQRDEVEEFLRFGSRDLPRRLVEPIVRAAKATDVDPIYLMALADKESSFRTDVRAGTSSAEGLFQFIDSTWLKMVKEVGAKHGLADEAAAITVVDDRLEVADAAMRGRILGLRCDPYTSAVMAGELLKRDAAEIGFRIGRRLTRTEMYLAHFLGLEDAARFIELRGAKRGRSAARAFPAAARANAAIFFAHARRGRRSLSVPEVYDRIDHMIDARLELYQGVQVYADAGFGS